MYPYLSRDIPIVFIGNTAESFCDYVKREPQAERQAHLIKEMQGLGDRALLFPAQSKLSIISHPIDHAALLVNHFGFARTTYLAPQNPSESLCLDILREPSLVDAILQQADPSKQVYLIPHATTPQFLELVSTLELKYGLNVISPESPKPECLWLRDYIDTKSGFHALVTPWVNQKCKLPLSISCHQLHQAAAVAYWFTVRHQSCIIKADRGNDALGHTVISPGEFVSVEEIFVALQHNSFLQDDIIIVEEFVEVHDNLFPSIELFVPPLFEGEPYVTYLCNQAFSEAGRFLGLLIDRDLYQQDWYPLLQQTALNIASNLQKMGYVGHFDLDTVIDHENNIFLLEINARRTGGTHVHETATFLIGHDYLNKATLLSNTGVDTGIITEFDTLLKRLNRFIFPMNNQFKGIIPTHTSSLSMGKFGYILAAASKLEALTLQAEMLATLEGVTP